MVLPALAMGLVRGAAFLGRGLLVAGRSTIRLLGSAARGTGRGLVRFSKPRLKKPPRRGKGARRKAPLKRKTARRPSKSKKNQVSLEMVSKFFKEHPQRMEAVKRKVLQEMATHVLQDIKGRLPDDQKELRDSLQVGYYPSRSPLYVVRAVPKSKRLENKDADTVILYVKPSTAFLKITPPKVRTLIEHSPWTLDTLPFMPRKRDGVVIKYTVPKKEVRRIRKLQAKHEYKWRPALQKAGVKFKTLTARDIQALPDLGHQSVQLEFGIGSASVPHWRPAVLWALRGGAQEIISQKNIQRAVADPRFEGWKKWKPLSRVVSTKEIASLLPFQHKLGIK